MLAEKHFFVTSALLFTEGDVDGSGSLDVHELVRFLPDHIHESAKFAAAYAFMLEIDDNANCALDRDEWGGYMRRCWEANPVFAQRFVDTVRKRGGVEMKTSETPQNARSANGAGANSTRYKYTERARGRASLASCHGRPRVCVGRPVPPPPMLVKKKCENAWTRLSLPRKSGYRRLSFLDTHGSSQVSTISESRPNFCPHAGGQII